MKTPHERYAVGKPHSSTILGTYSAALKTACHSEPFACHSERSEESLQFAQGKLREESRSGPETMRDSSPSADGSE